ncbi:hypothetical protein CAP36_07810 [Chitinophagaceae bacterium IBVUCB2]|nr:hypothetical protein CAP36_07810 [Chitinophagaceae bacterium IBVUCB2]
MSQEKFWILLAKKLSGETSADELHELENLIHEHPEWQFAVQNIGGVLKNHPLKDEIHAEDAYMLHLHRMAEMNIPFNDEHTEEPVFVASNRKAKWYWAAAAVLIVALGFFAFNELSGNKNPNGQLAAEINEISTRQGSKSKVQLPDGTVVWLNSGSKLTYDKEYGQKLREVILIGEGYFDVVKMKDKPFIIHTSAINIKVLGTVFNVKAYPEDKRTETSLLRGSIEVTIKNRPNDKIILVPSEKLVIENSRVIEKEEPKTTIPTPSAEPSINTLVAINKLKYGSSDSSVAETQWIDNKLVFRDESFAELAVKMQRWYGVEIEIKDTKIGQKRLNGIFENETVIQALDALKEFISFRYKQTGNKIIINR